MAVWMDCTNDAQPIPTWKNSIVAKITRINVEDDDDDDDDDADFARPDPAPAAPPAPARAPVSHQSSMHSNASSDHLDIFGGPSPNSSTQNSMPPSAPTGNLFDTTPPAPPSNVSSSGSSLLDMDNFGATPSQASQMHVHNDFLGMTAPPLATPAAPNRPPQQPYGAPPAQHNMYGQSTPAPQPPQQPSMQQNQKNAFDSFSNQQGPFGGLGTPWK